MNGLTKTQIALAALMLVVAASAGVAQWLATNLSCSQDTSYCAYSLEKTGVYEGTLRTYDGRPYRSAEFEVAFESRRDHPPISFQTDEAGHYCIRWAPERIAPSARTPSGEGLWGRERGFMGLGEWRDLEGRDPPPGCQESDEGIPWNRADDPERTWQYWLLTLLPTTAFFLLLWALIGRRSRRAVLLFASGAGLLALDLVAFSILWDIV